MPPLLSALIFLPLVAAIAIAAAPRGWAGAPRAIAATASGLVLAGAAAAYLRFNPQTAGPQLVEWQAWIPTIPVDYHLGVDGLSLPLVVLTALLTFLAILASWGTTLRPRLYFALLLVLESGVLGVFTALDLALFFLFWEVELIPMYLLIGIWGGPRREYAATKFVIYTLLGSGMMLVGILALYFQLPSPRTFDFGALANAHWDPTFAGVVFWFLFFGFAVKLPVFPFHTWLPDAHVQAPTAVSVLLAGVLLKMGGYGLLRVNVGILPEAAARFGWIIGVLAVINILYGAAVSLAQRDLKSLVAYSSISHMGYVLLGIAGGVVGVGASRLGEAAAESASVSLGGAAIQMFTHGMITALLFLLVGAVYERTHTRQIAELGGLASRLPLTAAIFLLAGLASLGLPGLAGFVAEFAIFVGAFPAMPWLTVLGAAGIVLTAGYVLWMIQRVFFGSPVIEAADEGRVERFGALVDVRGLEIVPLATLAALIVFIGVYPSVLTDVVNQGIAALSR